MSFYSWGDEEAPVDQPVAPPQAEQRHDYDDQNNWNGENEWEEEQARLYDKEQEASTGGHASNDPKNHASSLMNPLPHHVGAPPTSNFRERQRQLLTARTARTRTTTAVPSSSSMLSSPYPSSAGAVGLDEQQAPGRGGQELRQVHQGRVPPAPAYVVASRRDELDVTEGSGSARGSRDEGKSGKEQAQSSRAGGKPSSSSRTRTMMNKGGGGTNYPASAGADSVVVYHEHRSGHAMPIAQHRHQRKPNATSKGTQKGTKGPVGAAFIQGSIAGGARTATASSIRPNPYGKAGHKQQGAYYAYPDSHHAYDQRDQYVDSYNTPPSRQSGAGGHQARAYQHEQNHDEYYEEEQHEVLEDAELALADDVEADYCNNSEEAAEDSAEPGEQNAEEVVHNGEYNESLHGQEEEEQEEHHEHYDQEVEDTGHNYSQYHYPYPARPGAYARNLQRGSSTRGGPDPRGKGKQVAKNIQSVVMTAAGPMVPLADVWSHWEDPAQYNSNHNKHKGAGGASSKGRRGGTNYDYPPFPGGGAGSTGSGPAPKGKAGKKQAAGGKAAAGGKGALPRATPRSAGRSIHGAVRGPPYAHYDQDTQQGYGDYYQEEQAYQNQDFAYEGQDFVPQAHDHADEEAGEQENDCSPPVLALEDVNHRRQSQNSSNPQQRRSSLGNRSTITCTGGGRDGGQFQVEHHQSHSDGNSQQSGKQQSEENNSHVLSEMQALLQQFKQRDLEREQREKEREDEVKRLREQLQEAEQEKQGRGRSKSSSGGAHRHQAEEDGEVHAVQDSGINPSAAGAAAIAVSDEAVHDASGGSPMAAQRPPPGPAASRRPGDDPPSASYKKRSGRAANESSSWHDNYEEQSKPAAQTQTASSSVREQEVEDLLAQISPTSKNQREISNRVATIRTASHEEDANYEPSAKRQKYVFESGMITMENKNPEGKGSTAEKKPPVARLTVEERRKLRAGGSAAGTASANAQEQQQATSSGISPAHQFQQINHKPFEAVEIEQMLQSHAMARPDQVSEQFLKKSLISEDPDPLVAIGLNEANNDNLVEEIAKRKKEAEALRRQEWREREEMAMEDEDALEMEGTRPPKAKQASETKRPPAVTEPIRSDAPIEDADPPPPAIVDDEINKDPTPPRLSKPLPLWQRPFSCEREHVEWYAKRLTTVTPKEVLAKFYMMDVSHFQDHDPESPRDSLVAKLMGEDEDDFAGFREDTALYHDVDTALHPDIGGKDSLQDAAIGEDVLFEDEKPARDDVEMEEAADELPNEKQLSTTPAPAAEAVPAVAAVQPRAGTENDPKMKPAAPPVLGSARPAAPSSSDEQNEGVRLPAASSSNPKPKSALSEAAKDKYRLLLKRKKKALAEQTEQKRQSSKEQDQEEEVQNASAVPVRSELEEQQLERTAVLQEDKQVEQEPSLSALAGAAPAKPAPPLSEAELIQHMLDRKKTESDAAPNQANESSSPGAPARARPPCGHEAVPVVDVPAIEKEDMQDILSKAGLNVSEADKGNSTTQANIKGKSKEHTDTGKQAAPGDNTKRESASASASSSNEMELVRHLDKKEPPTDVVLGQKNRSTSKAGGPAVWSKKPSSVLAPPNPFVNSNPNPFLQKPFVPQPNPFAAPPVLEPTSSSQVHRGGKIPPPQLSAKKVTIGGLTEQNLKNLSRSSRNDGLFAGQPDLDEEEEEEEEENFSENSDLVVQKLMGGGIDNDKTKKNKRKGHKDAENKQQPPKEPEKPWWEMQKQNRLDRAAPSIMFTSKPGEQVPKSANASTNHKPGAAPVSLSAGKGKGKGATAAGFPPPVVAADLHAGNMNANFMAGIPQHPASYQPGGATAAAHDPGDYNEYYEDGHNYKDEYGDDYEEEDGYYDEDGAWITVPAAPKTEQNAAAKDGAGTNGAVGGTMNDPTTEQTSSKKGRGKNKKEDEPHIIYRWKPPKNLKGAANEFDEEEDHRVNQTSVKVTKRGRTIVTVGWDPNSNDKSAQWHRKMEKFWSEKNPDCNIVNKKLTKGEKRQQRAKQQRREARREQGIVPSDSSEDYDERIREKRMLNKPLFEHFGVVKGQEQDQAEELPVLT
eukprot:GSA120T00007562001.1